MEEPVMKTLLDSIPQTGRVDWIGVRPGRREEMEVLDQVEVKIGKGLVGDRFNGVFSSKRQVTIIQREHLEVVRSILMMNDLDPGLLRRNIVVEGINLLSLKGKEFRIGDAVLKTTGLCHPCSRMEQNLGPGGYNAMRGHGGITARVVQGGMINVGDKVYLEGLGG